jgi:hypothetical protein
VAFLYTIEFYSATKKNEILSFVGKWFELENINLSEFSQTQKEQKPHVLFHMSHIDLIIQMQKFYETLVTLGVILHWRGDRVKEEAKNLDMVNIFSIYE